MKYALVINCSGGNYNLGAVKLATYLRTQGYCVEESRSDPGMFAVNYDLVCLSVIFSFTAPMAAGIANNCKRSCEVWAGGPGLFSLKGWWKRETGLDCHVGLDHRFEKQPGEYKMTFASRGCPVGCYFCIVPRLEGREFTLDWDFMPAPILCDNNLSALPVPFQEHIIQRYQKTGIPLMDANSGFEPRTFDEGTYRRWKPILRGPWRFAFDEQAEAEDVRRMMAILKDEPSRRKQVYVLAGNEPLESCYERAQKVIEWGGEPFCQFVMPLTWLGPPAPLKTRHGWTHRQGRDFCRYYNRHLWRSMPISEYKDRREPVAPFVRLAT